MKRSIPITAVLFITALFTENISGNSTVMPDADISKYNSSDLMLVKDAPNLYPGEEMFEVIGFQTLAKFEKGKPGKPLVVFIPGYQNTARIAYGYPGGNPKDFLDYWLQEECYSFLGISFPLENSIFNGNSTQFTMKAWADQIAGVTDYYLTKNNMPKNIILITWSYSGVVLPGAAQALKAKGIDVEFYTAFESLPPIFNSHTSDKFAKEMNLTINPNGYISLDKTYKNLFLELLSEQNTLNGHVIIPNNVYLEQITGNNPVITLQVTTANSNFHVSTSAPQIPNPIDYSIYPICANITGNATLFNSNVLLDNASWTFVNVQSIMQNQLSGIDYTKLSKDQWNNIQNIINSLPQTLHMQVDGNHFFFVGEKGAKQTAENITIFASRVETLKRELKENTKVH